MPWAVTSADGLKRNEQSSQFCNHFSHALADIVRDCSHVSHSSHELRFGVAFKTRMLPTDAQDANTAACTIHPSLH
jgi:hypothetical protein